MAKKVDFQQLLLQRGERIGLGVAVALTLLLLVLSLFMSGHGLLAGSSSEKAATLDTSSTYVESEIRNPNNLPGEDLKPKTPSEKDLVGLSTERIDAKPYQVALGPPPGGSVVGGRRVPKIYPIEEGTGDSKFVQVQSYMFAQVREGDPPRIYVVKHEGRSGNTGPGAPGVPGGAAGGRPGDGRGGSGAGPGMGAGMFQGAQGQQALRQAALRGRRGNRNFNLFTSKKELDEDDKQLRDVLLSEYDKTSSGEVPAKKVLPVRMAILAASFPYKQQVEEFRKQLGLKTRDEVLAEVSPVPGPNNQPVNSFRFMGVDVERRALDLDGKPVENWRRIDIDDMYRSYVVATGKEFEEDDDEVKMIAFRGLVMPRLKQLRDGVQAGSSGMAGVFGPMGMGGTPGRPGGAGGRPGSGSMGGPPGMGGGAGPGSTAPASGSQIENQYPNIEKTLPTIRKTLDALKDKGPAVVARPPKFDGGDFDPYNPDAAAGAAAPAGPGAGSVGPVPPAAGGAAGAPGDPNAQGTEIPEHCLVRIIDVTVKPGTSYEYRLRVRMANPNFGRRDVASVKYASKPLLESEWSKTTIKVKVDSDLHYFAVDQLEVHRAERKRSDRYKGPGFAINPDRQVVLQAHRWLESLKVGQNSGQVNVGEWVVAERFPVYRGEYIGRSERLEVPIWRPARENWVIANDGLVRNKRSTVVSFGYQEEGDQPEALLVDFHTLGTVYDRVVSRTEEKVDTRKVSDTSAGEVLILNPNGKLILRDVAADVADKGRRDRVEKVHKRVESVKHPGKSSSDPKRPFSEG